MLETPEKAPSETSPNPGIKVERGGDAFSHLSPVHLQDLQFLENWLSRKSHFTKKRYRRVGEELLAELHPKSLRDASPQILQMFLDYRTYRKEGTKYQRGAIVKSLFMFAVKTGYLTANIGPFLPQINMNSNLTERYLAEDELLRMIHLTKDPRDLAILKTLYSGGLRVSELVSLNWGWAGSKSNES